MKVCSSDKTIPFFFVVVHTEVCFHMVDLEELFELPVISSFNILRDKIAEYIDFTNPPDYAHDIKPLEFIRLYHIEDDRPICIIHEPNITTLK